MDILQTFSKLNACFAPSGQEEDLAACIRELGAPLVDDHRTDALGNLILHKKGPGPALLFAAHMDSIGLLITHIEEDGFLRFGAIGGLRPENILQSRILFRSGLRGTIVRDQSVDWKKVTPADLLVDIGASSKEEAEQLVHIGEAAVFDGDLHRLAGGRILSPYLDNRLSCAVLLAALARCGDSPWDLYLAFTVQEEPGLRGAGPLAFDLDPAYAVVCDVTVADDQPGSKHDSSTALGKGAAIKIMDRSLICHPQMVTHLKQLADRLGIPRQNDVLLRGGTDGGPIHTSRAGVITGGISIPIRYLHSPNELADLADAESCAALLCGLMMQEEAPGF